MHSRRRFWIQSLCQQVWFVYTLTINRLPRKPLYILGKKYLYSTYSSFLVINVWNQGKTLCSPCMFQWHCAHRKSSVIAVTNAQFEKAIRLNVKYIPRHVCQFSGGYWLANFESNILYQVDSKSQPTRSNFPSQHNIPTPSRVMFPHPVLVHCSWKEISCIIWVFIRNVFFMDNDICKQLLTICYSVCIFC